MSTNDKTKLDSLTSVMRYMGNKATITALPTAGNTTGDV